MTDILFGLNAEARCKAIAEQNDKFRKSITIAPQQLSRIEEKIAGRVLVTSGVADFGQLFVCEALAKVQTFDDFSEENNPNGERDFGSFTLKDQTLFWKIDYYDNKVKYGSPNPANPRVTHRVLTVMLSRDY